MKSNTNSLEQNAQLTDGNKIAANNEASKSIITHHLSSFLDNNLAAVMSDYTNESVLITQNGTFKGLEQIEDFFSNLMAHFPKQKSSLDLETMKVNGRLVYIVWNAKTPSLEVALGSDTYTIVDGKIFEQTFVGQLKFIN